ncbi:MAG: hypothetical protein HQM15_03105 [Deltaproteobacteria bacterium]|nr:hypothetical protein [Deltaproteobacteria bacterium]
MRTAERLAPQPLLFARLMGVGVLLVHSLSLQRRGAGERSQLGQELLDLGRDLLSASKSAVDSWCLCFHQGLFHSSPEEQREQGRAQALEYLLRTVDQADHTLAEQHLDGSLGQRIGLAAVENSLRNASILFATGTSDRLSLLANYAASVVSGYAQYQLARTPLSMHSLLLSAVIGLVNGATQSCVNITHQMGQMNEQQLHQNRTTLVWQGIKGALIGAGSGFAECLVGQILHGLPLTHPFGKMILSAAAFSLGDVEGEKVSTDLLDWIGVRLGLEETQLNQARGIYGFIENATQEVGGGFTHGLSPVALLHVGGLGVAAEQEFLSSRSKNSVDVIQHEVCVASGVSVAARIATNYDVLPFVNQMSAGFHHALDATTAFSAYALHWVENLFQAPHMVEGTAHSPLILAGMLQPGVDLKTFSLATGTLMLGGIFSRMAAWITSKRSKKAAPPDHSSHEGATVKIDAATPQTVSLIGTDTASVESQRVQKHIEYLRSLKPLVDQYGSYAAVLGGESAYSCEGAFQLDTQFLLDEGFALGRRPLRKGQRLRVNVGSLWETGCDWASVENARYYKFYLSLDLSSSEQLREAQSFLRELLIECKKQKLSLRTKALDHVYDSCNLYTYHREAMAAIIQRLYKKYPRVWKSTEHFFQGPLEGVNPQHMGYVEESGIGSALRASGAVDSSHSGRMARLGAYLDQELAKGRILDEQLFREAAQSAKQKPDEPWLIDVGRHQT